MGRLPSLHERCESSAGAGAFFSYFLRGIFLFYNSTGQIPASPVLYYVVWWGLAEAATEMSSRKLDKHVALWSMETIAQCLGYCRDWNTNAKKAIVVHAVLGSILRCVGIASLKEIPVSDDRKFFQHIPVHCMPCCRISRVL